MAWNFLHLVKTKTGAYRYRRRVPDQLRPAIGKTEIIRSLKTRSESEVPKRHAQVHAEVEQLFAQARTNGSMPEDTLFEESLASLRALGVALGKPEHFDDIQSRSFIEEHLLAESGYSSIHDFSEQYSGSPQDKRLSMKLGILTGKVIMPRPTLSYCWKQFFKEYERGKKRSTDKITVENYKRERERIISEVIKIIGDKEITQISRQDARLFREQLELRYKKGSIDKQLSFLKAMFNFAIRELGISLSNPFAGLRISDSHLIDTGRKSFRYDEVVHLLKCTETLNEELKDIFIFLVFTGARLAEISGLTKEDIILSSQVPHISIRYNTIRGLKNQSSIRTVPMLADVLSIAKDRIVRLENARDDAPLFPRYGRLKGSDSASAALSKWLRNRVQIRDKSKTIHSIRHTFKDLLRDVKVPKELGDMIQGHTTGDASSRYGTNELLVLKKEALENCRSLLMTAL